MHLYVVKATKRKKESELVFDLFLELIGNCGFTDKLFLKGSEFKQNYILVFYEYDYKRAFLTTT